MAARMFRFRAQAALDLRTRELQDAQRELARAVEVREIARHRSVEAYATATAARTRAAEAQRTPGHAVHQEWHRSWIIRLDHEGAAHAATLADRAADAERASAACVVARQRRESLERFREKSRLAFEAEQQAADMKLIDELATRRYAVRQQSAPLADS